MMHHPVYSTAPDRDNPKIREALKPLFDVYHVDLVLQGHDHAYGRGRSKNLSTGVTTRDGAKGPVYVVSVSGPKQYGTHDDDWMVKSGRDLQLYQYINIKDDTLLYRAYTADGVLYDSFQLQKNGEGDSLLIE